MHVLHIKLYCQHLKYTQMASFEIFTLSFF